MVSLRITRSSKFTVTFFLSAFSSFLDFLVPQSLETFYRFVLSVASLDCFFSMQILIKINDLFYPNV